MSILDLNKDLKLFALIIGLVIIQAVLDPGPLREGIEIWLVLQMVPRLDFIIDMMNLLSSTEPGSIIFYIKFFVILLQNVATVWLYIRFKKRFFGGKNSRHLNVFFF